MGFFNFQFESDVRYVKGLMNQGKCKEAVAYMAAHTPIGIGYQYAEAYWIMTQCYYQLQEYNWALNSIRTLINLPIGTLTLKQDAIRSFQRKALDLKEKIEREMAKSNEKVKFPSRPFANFIETIPMASSDSFVEAYEGLSENYGSYYIKNSIETKGKDIRINVYLKPVSECEMEVFIYVDFIKIYFEKTEDDVIVSQVFAKKFPTMAKLIKTGKNGAAHECCIYKSHDYNRPSLENHPPVLGKKVFVSNSREVKLAGLEDTVNDIEQMYWKLIKEIDDNPITVKDNAEIALLAMLKGAMTKVVGTELGPKIKDMLWAFFH